MKLINYFLAVVTVAIIITGCNKDTDEVLQTTELSFTLLSPSNDITITEYVNVTVKFKELNSSSVTTETVTELPLNVELPQGSYEVSVEGTIKYKLDGVEREGSIGAFISELNLATDTASEKIQLVLKSFSNDFIIEEVFFTGTRTPSGDSYWGDKYFKLYNNTDEVLYADGLIIANSAFLTTSKQNYTPDVMSEAFTTEAMIQIPGSGTEYPVQPGEAIIVTDDGINHIENNANSIDLSSANFEMFYENTSDVDAPNVPNVINLYERFIFHNRGFHSYVIARLPEGVTNESFLADNKYVYTYTFEFNGVSYPMGDYDAYKIPNEWVLDAVNLSIESDFQWIITNESLDSGWTYCGKVDRDDNRMGKAVRRKVLQEVDGRRILKDTNNSTLDFEAEVKPSLMK